MQNGGGEEAMWNGRGRGEGCVWNGYKEWGGEGVILNWEGAMWNGRGRVDERSVWSGCGG